MAGAGRAAGTLKHLLGLLLGSPAPALSHLQGTGPCHVSLDGVRRSLPALGSGTHQNDPTASAPESNLFPSEIIEWSVLESGLAFWDWSQEGDVGGTQQHSREERPRIGRKERRLGTELTPFKTELTAFKFPF